jgi:hypothetical protein
LHGISLFEIFKDELRPTIVKFVSEKFLDKGCIEAAIAYLYSSLTVGRPESSAVYCFDGENTVVPFSDIVSVQHVD